MTWSNMLLCRLHWRHAFLCLLSIPTIPAATCYRPDGKAHLDHTPCNENAADHGPTACCHPSDFCLSNGFCLREHDSQLSNRVSRGSCTTPDWSPDCGAQCGDVQVHQWSVDLWLVDEDTGKFCCGGPQSQSDGTCPAMTNGDNMPFPVTPGRIVWNRTDGSVMQNGSLTVEGLGGNGTNTVTTTVTATAEGKVISEETYTATAAGLAVALSVLLFVSWAAMLVMWRRMNKLRKRSSGGGMPAEPGNDGEQQGLSRAQSPAPPYQHRGSQPYVSPHAAGPLAESGGAERNELPAEVEIAPGTGKLVPRELDIVR